MASTHRSQVGANRVVEGQCRAASALRVRLGYQQGSEHHQGGPRCHPASRRVSARRQLSWAHCRSVSAEVVALVPCPRHPGRRSATQPPMDAGGGDSGLRNPGWQSRLGERTGMSVCVGAAVGTLLSVLRNEPALSTAARTSGSFGIIGATFFSFSELCRLLRQEDGRANSVLAGAASGALLRGVHHGRGFVLPGAIGGSLLAWAGHGAVALWRDGLPVRALWPQVAGCPTLTGPAIPGRQPGVGVHPRAEAHRRGGRTEAAEVRRQGEGRRGNRDAPRQDERFIIARDAPVRRASAVQLSPHMSYRMQPGSCPGSTSCVG